jgi:hypothetical protein
MHPVLVAHASAPEAAHLADGQTKSLTPMHHSIDKAGSRASRSTIINSKYAAPERQREESR